MPDHEAIRKIYVAFSRYRLPSKMTSCSCCYTAQDEASLHADVAALPSNVITNYVWDALHHIGDEADFKHFVPRVYELLAEGQLPFADPEMVIGRLAEAHWSEWDANEQDSVKAVLDGLWEDAMRLEDPPVDIDSLVCGLVLAFRGLPPQVQNWLSSDHASRPMSRTRLVELVLANAQELPDGRLGDPWWRDHLDTMADVVRWILSWEVEVFLSDALDSDLVVVPALDILSGARARAVERSATGAPAGPEPD